MNEVRQRLLKFIEYLGIKKNAFEQTVGMSNGFVNNTNGQIRKRTLDAISAAYPQLNIDWLKNGRGEMIKELPTTSNDQETNSEVAELIKRIDKLIEVHERDSRNIENLLKLLMDRRDSDKEKGAL